MPTDPTLPLADPDYRAAWLAGYRQAMEDIDQATKQILARPISKAADHDSTKAK